jgi:ATP-dependent helicase Lhr and Lhr-like helicase
VRAYENWLPIYEYLVLSPPMNLAQLFHPAVAKWFVGHFVQTTPAQARAWPAIKAGHHTLIAAPTGSGKTLAAFLAAIDDLVRQSVEGPLADATQVVYVSPLKALSNDIQRNLEAPLAGIRAELRRSGLPDLRSVPGCVRAIPRRQNASACAGGHRTFW